MKPDPADLALRRALGEALRSLRGRQKPRMSQEALAFEAGVSRSYMSKLERAGSDVGLWMLWRLKDALKISLSRFVREIELHASEVSTTKPVSRRLCTHERKR